MGDYMKLTIHYGGTMKRLSDLDGGGYEYLEELGCKSIFWKISEIKWQRFEEFVRSERVLAPINLLWFKAASEDMKKMQYVFDSANSDMGCLTSVTEAEVDVYVEHECSEHVAGGDTAYFGGYEPDEDMNQERRSYYSNDDSDEDVGRREDSEYGDDESNEDDRPPKEDDEPEESEDESPSESENGKGKESEGEGLNENATEGVNTEVDDGDEVIVDAGDGGDDPRFKAAFEEASRTTPQADEVARKLATEMVVEEKDEDVETDPEFGFDDPQYPDTPLEFEEEWEEWKNPKKGKKKDKYHGDLMKEPYLWLFQTFGSGLEFKDQLLRYSLNTQYDIKMAKSQASRIAAICCKEKCGWKVHCSYEKRINKWMVKTCYYKHNHGKSSRVSMLKQGVIAGLFREEIRRNLNLQANEIKYIIKERYDIVVKLTKCYKARRIALDSVLEAQAIQFAKLWDYEAELQKIHPDISTEIVTVENNGRHQFQAFYICFDEFRSSWIKSCRPVIGLDGCFLKWDLEGDLLAAVGRDADNKMFPIAWAVVTGENKDTWGWFINKLKTDLVLGVGENLTIISDKQKGLVHAMSVELPKAEHRMCARHIYANWKKFFSRSEYKNLFWGVAYSYHQGEYEQRMKMVYDFDPFAYEALLKQDPEKWCRAFFSPDSHCTDVHNNLSEAFNRTIKIARTKPVISLLEDIRSLAMTRVSRRSLKADKLNSYLTPITMAILEKARTDKKFCKTLRSSSVLYEVREFDVGYTVDLVRHQCACRKWDLTGIPCKHAVCVFDDNQDDPENYVAGYYETSCLKSTYERNIKPVNGDQFWPKTWKPLIAIPNIRKPRGRPKKRDRKKEPFESLENPGKASRHGRIPHCSRCGEAGHNKKGCRNEPVVVEGPKNRRGRPRKVESEFPPMRQPKKRNTKPKLSSQTASSSSQPVPANQSSSDMPASSSAPQPTVSSIKPKPKRKRGPPLKVRKVDNIPRGVGTFYAPYTGRVFDVFGDRVYDRSSNEPPQPPPQPQPQHPQPPQPPL